jgi:type IV pilus assembly protein PilO
MDWQNAIQELKDFDVNELDFENVGSWPVLVKGIVCIVLFVGVLVLGNVYIVSDLRLQLASTEAKESELRETFKKRAFEAANLDAYRRQMTEIEASFGALVDQLPSDTEVPGLLEDITNKAVENGLTISSIKLQPEQAKEFYVELPISISVEGSYHDMAAFVSGVAGLPRIVTLHDFSIKSNQKGTLQMDISAKTYRYRSGGV